MGDTLRLNTDSCRYRKKQIDGHCIEYREYRDIPYCTKPSDKIQKLNIYIPEAYFHNETIGQYDKDSAPVFLPNTVGGYMPGPSDEPGIDSHTGKLNSLFLALEHGYVAVSAGVRGRTSGKIATEFYEGSKEGALGEETGRMVGRAPAFIVDLKAAIRFLRHNSDLLFGDFERIITNGTSAGGALSALAGAAGNSSYYEEYLKQIGAADERDDIFAASCYCPIHNLENADSAYEWQFCGLNDYHRTRHQRTETGIIRVPDEGWMDEEQIRVSAELKDLFPAYLNSLELKDETGRILTLNENGEGSFKEYLKRYIVDSADLEYQSHRTKDRHANLMVKGSDVEEQDYLRVENGNVSDLDWDGYIRKITRMKAAPAFDSLDLKSPENEEFGDEDHDGRHFTDYSFSHSHVQGEKADQRLINIMNPLYFVLNEKEGVCRNWRIRHGAFDRDTSLAVPLILATALKNRACNVDFRFPWGLPHSGDYDLEELFAWIDNLCAQKR